MISKAANELARKMVCEWGMSDVLGPLTFGKKTEAAIFLGGGSHSIAIIQNRPRRDYRDVRDIDRANYRRAREILSAKVDLLIASPKALSSFRRWTEMKGVERICKASRSSADACYAFEYGAAFGFGPLLGARSGKGRAGAGTRGRGLLARNGFTVTGEARAAPDLMTSRA